VNLYNTPIDIKVNRSGVHVTVEAFKCGKYPTNNDLKSEFLENSVVRDFEWTGMKKIEKSFVENSKKDRNLLRQYIGTNSGLTRVFPGKHKMVVLHIPINFLAFLWEREPLLSVDLFNPIHRPWFFGAEVS
jgi:hypothetical protein